MNNRMSVRNLVLAAMFIALGLLLPFVTGSIPALGARFLPMHLPVLIAGFVLGGPLGFVVGLITPLLRSLMMGGMPPLYPTAIAMSIELAVYGLMTGVLYRLLPKKIPFIYVALVIAMIVGRIVWGLATFALMGLAGNAFTWQMFIAGAFVNAIPGIIVQIILVPLIVIALKKAHLIDRTAMARS